MDIKDIEEYDLKSSILGDTMYDSMLLTNNMSNQMNDKIYKNVYKCEMCHKSYERKTWDKNAQGNMHI